LEEVGCSAFNGVISIFAPEATMRARMIAFVKQYEYCRLTIDAAEQVYSVPFVQTTSPFPQATASRASMSIPSKRSNVACWHITEIVLQRKNAVAIGGRADTRESPFNLVEAADWELCSFVRRAGRHRVDSDFQNNP
jgi:hypothetical protein